ncbi:MAG: hypothetical protein ABIS18_04220 [Actinomycetota bacterium]
MARRFEGKIQILTIGGQDSEAKVAEAIKAFGWPRNIINTFDKDGSVWAAQGIRFRGTWILINQDGTEVKRFLSHPPADQLVAGLEELAAR